MRNRPTFPRPGAWESGLWPPVGGLSANCRSRPASPGPSRNASATALSRQISIGDFRRGIRPSAAAIHEQKQWSSNPPWGASRQYRNYSDNARHLPTEIRYQVLRIRPDHVIEDMLHGFGADLVKVQASRYPKLFQYVDNSKSQGLKLGYVERNGIRRYFDGFGSSSLEKRSKAQFVACRWLLQY